MVVSLWNLRWEKKMANEKRLIDANALLVANMYGNTAPITHRTYAEMLIQKAPTVDAVEVVHGHWDLYFDGKELQCSACKATFWDEEQNGGTNYCPNCGAKMDGERKDNESVDG